MICPEAASGACSMETAESDYPHAVLQVLGWTCYSTRIIPNPNHVSGERYQPPAQEHAQPAREQLPGERDLAHESLAIAVRARRRVFDLQEKFRQGTLSESDFNKLAAEFENNIYADLCKLLKISEEARWEAIDEL